jgi:hypothetical protein
MAYRVFRVESYVLRHERERDRPWVILHYKEDGAWRNVNWFPPAENAGYIADLLRHEKPVYWVPEGEYLTTSAEIESPPDLGEWLGEHPAVRSAIVWEDTSGSAEAYADWPASRKAELQEAFLALWNHADIPFNDPPPNQAHPADDEHATTVLAEVDAWRLYSTHVAQSLAVETGHWVLWSLSSYPAASLAPLLDGREMFRWDADAAGYRIEQSKGRVIPAPPDHTFDFLVAQDLVGNSPLETIGRVLEWCRAHLIHFSGAAEAANMEDQWQYRGYPPVSRILAGTPFTSHPEWGVRHRTAGCRGTTGFLRALLRTVNIPVEQVHACGHALPRFPGVGRYLTHGDDPYNALTRATPPFPAGDLLIGQSKFDDWFGAGVPDEEACDNVGRRTRELAIEHLPDYLLHKRCSDLSQGNPHPSSLVFESFERNYTVAELEAADLWDRMDAKIAGFGGCEHVP